MVFKTFTKLANQQSLLKDVDRNLLINQSTGLSTKLTKGEVSPKELLIAINDIKKSQPLSEGQKKYIDEIKRQIVFREFARSAVEQQSYRQPPGAKPADSPEFQKLKAGQTGIPIVDAAVREMQETGRPHNRARLLLARYAIRNLNIDPEAVAM